MRCMLLAALLAAPGLLAGCARIEPKKSFDGVREALSERSELRVEWRGVTAEDQGVDDAVEQMLQSELSVDQAVQIALLNNRNLQATYEELGVAQAELVQAGLLSNPVFEFDPRWPVESGFRFSYELTVVQDFLEILVLPLRKRVAEANFQAAQLRVADAVLQTAAQVKAAFYRLQGAQQMTEMRQTVVEATEASADAARRLREAGNITDLDLINERALYEQARLELANARIDATEAREELNALMGLKEPDLGWRVAARLPEPPVVELESGALESLAVSQRLDLAAARQEIKARQRTVALVRRSRIPFSLGVHSEEEPDRDGAITVGPHLEAQVPLFDQGQAKVAAALALLRQSQQRYLALDVEIRSQVRRLSARTLSARARVESYRQVVLPLRSQALEQTQLQFNAMQLGVFQLLMAKQAQVEAGRQYVEALRDYWLARAELERAVGGTLRDVATTQPATMPAAQPVPATQPQEIDQHHH